MDKLVRESIVELVLNLCSLVLSLELAVVLRQCGTGVYEMGELLVFVMWRCGPVVSWQKFEKLIALVSIGSLLIIHILEVKCGNFSALIYLLSDKLAVVRVWKEQEMGCC